MATTAREPRRIASALEFRPEAFLCNISEETFQKNYDFGVIIVEGRKPGEEYRVTRVEWRASRANKGEDSTVQEISALEIARDVARQCNADIGEHSFAGVFVIENGASPSRGELEEAHASLRRRYEHAVGVAKGQWERERRTDWITDEQRRAARYLNLTNEPWLASAAPQELCPGCGIPHLPGIAKCGHCGAILDAEKAAKLYPELREALAPAKPKERRREGTEPAEK